MQSLHLLLLAGVLLADRADKSPHIADVVSQSDAAEGLDEDQDNGLVVVGGRDVSKAHCQHDVSAPVVSPNVLYKPALVTNLEFGDPVVCFAHLSHQIEDDR